MTSLFPIISGAAAPDAAPRCSSSGRLLIRQGLRPNTIGSTASFECRAPVAPQILGAFQVSTGYRGILMGIYIYNHGNIFMMYFHDVYNI